MAGRNLFQILQAELNQQNDSDSEMSSGDEYVPSDTSDSDVNLLEEDKTERTEKEEASDSDKEIPTQVCGDKSVNFYCTGWNCMAVHTTSENYDAEAQHYSLTCNANQLTRSDSGHSLNCTFLINF